MIFSRRWKKIIPDKVTDGKGFGLLFEMGCGKSLTALAIAGVLFQEGKAQRVLVAAPGSVVAVWKDELERFAAFPYTFAPLLGTKAKRLRNLAALEETGTGQLWAGINYESTFRDGIFEALMEFHPDLVICDESQRIKGFKNKQTMAMVEIAERAPYRLILSGTPIQQNAADIFSQFQFLDSTVFGDNYYAFSNRYLKKGGFGGKQIIGTKNEAELTQRMHSISYRVTKAEALDLPPETYEYRSVILSGQERKYYNDMCNAAVVELSKQERVEATTVLTKLLRLQQIAGGFLRTDEDGKLIQVGSSKLEALSDIMDDYAIHEGKKLVVFAKFIPEIDAIKALAESKGLGYRWITGDVPIDERGQVVNEFQNDENIKIFIAQIQTAGLGITLHASSVAVFYSLGYNYADYQQALARIHRKGQHHPCTYIILEAKDTVDQKIMAALEKKGDIAKSICDNWQQYFM